ncbi:MAG: hypothetical protein AB7L28_21135, partial [Kofleriaceae bacterium]
ITDTAGLLSGARNDPTPWPKPPTLPPPIAAAADDPSAVTTTPVSSNSAGVTTTGARVETIPPGDSASDLLAVTDAGSAPVHPSEPSAAAPASDDATVESAARRAVDT